MRVQLPVPKFAITVRRPMPTHRVRKRNFEEIVVSGKKTFENFCQTDSFGPLQVGQAQDGTLRQQAESHTAKSPSTARAQPNQRF